MTKPLKIRASNHILPTYANFAVLDTKKDEVVLNFCFAEGDTKHPEAVLVHKVVMTPLNLQSLHTRIGELLEAYQMRHGLLGK
ncbi:hypothetical protein L1280_000351 [Deinococcus sp. HSC-46F16]|uniref:DUF3467 domain-containing protein n=1 Tax=Deinococcus sp. HSC-46F16 TaxID=2910968 RepID=UPI00209C718E|nr:DUF3467 domain-containing protein [Deinococcus sp. HSC-46F16]MCP2013223.1 hypothetical protein [Deinococcus sp. HSC-46F16]